MSFVNATTTNANRACKKILEAKKMYSSVFCLFLPYCL